MFEMTTETGCTIKVADPDHPNLSPDKPSYANRTTMALAMRQPDDRRYAEVLLTDAERRMLGEALLGWREEGGDAVHQ